MDALTDTPRPRAPLFRRIALDPFRITERDLDFLEAIGRHGTVQSRHLEALFPAASPQQLRRRLKLLYHGGLLARPEAQRSYMLDHQGSLSLAYLLTEEGAAAVAARRGVHFSLKPDDLKFGQLAHRLEITDVMVGMEAACWRSEFLAFEPLPDILARGPHATRTNTFPETWKISLTYRGTFSTFHITPDATFAVSHREAVAENNPRARKFFFLEADRGGMAIERSSLLQTSILRKLLCYAKTHREGIHRDRFGMNNMRVLFVTQSRKRIDAMIRTFDAHLTGIASPRLFLFTDRGTLFAKDTPFFDRTWLDGEGKEHTLFE